MKSLLNMRYLYKVSSGRLSKHKWDMTLTRGEAIKNNELISLASSNAIRMIDKLNENPDIDNEINALKQQIKELKFNNAKSKREVATKIGELNTKIFINDIVFVVMNSKKDYDRANKGFKINGINYVRLLATSGGVKKSTIIYCSERLHEKLYKCINGGRDLTKKFVPAKLEAYLSLSFSASLPISTPKGVLVVHDVETTFLDDVILIDDVVDGRPQMSIVKGYETKLNACDGLGLMTPEQAFKWSQELQEDYLTSGICVRNCCLKGFLFSFDFKQFASEVAKTDVVYDVWGQEHNINDIDVILTTSQLKLWDSYKNINHYLECCKENLYEFSATKIIPKELDNEQTMNYQFLQSLKLSDEDIYELCKPTIDEIHEILNFDYRKSLLYLRGTKMNETNIMSNMNDYTTAMMIDNDLINDKYVFNKIKHNIKKRIDDAKMGVINVKGNFSTVSGDPYCLCQSVFGLEITGLLKSGEFYSNYWNKRNVSKIVGLRAPMSCSNNIVVRNLVNNDEVNKWYKYMPCVTIFNAWDNSCSSLNGCDYDGDTLMTTDNNIILKGVSEELLPIICTQGSASKCTPTEKDFILANKQSFGSDIGVITNYATAMYNVITKFEEDSEEYKELDYRIKCIQKFQQDSID